MRSLKLFLPGVLLILFSSGAWAGNAKVVWHGPDGNANSNFAGTVVGTVTFTAGDSGDDAQYHVHGTFGLQPGTLDIADSGLTDCQKRALDKAITEGDANNWAKAKQGELKGVGDNTLDAKGVPKKSSP